MNKNAGAVFILFLMLLSILASAFQSAGVQSAGVTGNAAAGITGKVVSGFSSFIDFMKSKLSGKATSQSVNLNITVPNTAPQVTFVSTIASQSVLEASVRNTEFNFLVFDQDDYEDIASANATFANITGNMRFNSSCLKTNTFGAKYQNFSCTIGLWYFDNSGVWNVTVIAKDNSSNTAVNGTTNFALLQTAAVVTSPATITWAAIAPNNTNKTASNFLQLNNTANTAIGDGNISINATDLVGETYSAYALYAGNFSIGITSGNASCNATTSTSMRKSSYTNISSALLPYGNLSRANGEGQEEMYLCMRYAGSELFAQNYSTAGQGAWTIRVQ
ncbi:hypothetical protein J4447_01030 [Candidatus Pacearchaeota archaeon]|nr:hypothetical protein [Candidatus Pacearchaeota archaeon]